MRVTYRCKVTGEGCRRACYDARCGNKLRLPLCWLKKLCHSAYHKTKER